jgi:hypothetical protein
MQNMKIRKYLCLKENTLRHCNRKRYFEKDPQNIKSINRKIAYFNLRSFCIAKETINKVKKQHAE